MKLKVFTLRPDEETGRLDDGELESFFGDPDHPREVLEISEHFFVHEHQPRWAILTMYRDEPRAGGSSGNREKRDWRAELTRDEKPLFDELRTWRGRKSKGDGLPGYIIATNRQLADIARNKPCRLDDLLQISGLGPGKVSRWGEEILALVRAYVPEMTDDGAEVSHG